MSKQIKSHYDQLYSVMNRIHRSRGLTTFENKIIKFEDEMQKTSRKQEMVKKEIK